MTPDPIGRPLQGDSRQQYEQLVASVDGIVWEVDVATFLFTFVSQQAERLLGYPLEQWYAPGFWLEHLHADDRQWAYEFCLHATREKRPHEMEYRMIAADGRTVWLRDIVSVVVEGDVAVKLRGIMVDVTQRRRTEETLRQSEADLRLALDAARLGEWSWDLVTGRITWSPLLKALYGLPPDAEITYERYLAFIHPDDRARTDFDVKRAVETRSDYESEKRVIWPDGSVHWNVARGRVVCDDSGRPLRITGVTIDITERKRAEEALRDSEELHRFLAENSNDIITLLNQNGRHVYVSPSWERLLGPRPADPFEPVHPDDLPEVRRVWEQVLAGNKGFVTFRYRDASGGWHWLEAWGLLVQYKGRPHIMGVNRDVTKRKQAEEALRHAESQLRTLIENYPDFIARFDRECRHLYVSPSVTRAFGISLERFAGKTLHELAIPGPPGQNEALEEGIRQAFERGVQNVLEARWPTPKGERIFEVCHIPEPDEHGRVTSVLGLTRDITERKRAEEALRRSEAYLAQAQRLSRTGSWAWNVANRDFVHWSQEHYRLHGLDPQKGIPSWEEASQFIHPEERARCLADIERAITERRDCELDYRAVLPDGSIKFIHSVARPLFDAAGNLMEFVGTELDVTERKQAEAALRDSEQRYREVFNCSSECIFLIDVDPDGCFRFAAFNPAEEQAVGFTNAEVAGRYIEDVIPPDLAAVVIPNFRRCVEAGKLISYDEELNLPTGRKKFHTSLVPVREETGRIYRIIGVASDVTAVRQAEAALRRSEEMLRRAQEIGRVGSWVYEVRDETFLGSEEGYRMCGWDPGTHRLEELLVIVHPDDLPPMQTAWQATLAGANYEIEHRLVVDEKVRWVHVRAEPEFDAEGQVVRVTGITQDVTDRKKGEDALRASLREKEVLLKEVHHRVKNNLQLINSLLSLQASKLKDRAAAEAFAESQNRVRAMALVHENLYRSGDLASVRLAAHLESLCAHLLRSYNINPVRIAFDFRVAEVTLDLDRSLRLGLLVNELVSNAFKHAFPAGRSGRVLVQLDSPCVGCYSLIVSDNGVGLAPKLAPGHSDSLGLQLIADLTEQLDGTIVLAREGGTTYSVRFPASCPEDSRS